MEDVVRGGPTLAEWLEANPYRGPFKAVPHYNRDGDMVQHYAKSESCYGEYIDPYLTIFRSHETNEIIGAEIAGIRLAIKEAEDMARKYDEGSCVSELEV